MLPPTRRSCRKMLTALGAGALMLCLGGASAQASGGGGSGGGGGSDRAAQAAERAERDAARAAERASRDQVRYAEDRARILERTASDPVRQAEELAKLEADRAEDLTRAQEEADKIADRLAEELGKAQEDALEDAADHAEQAAEYGSSSQLRDLASDERPDFDERGYPVRRGEITGLDLGPDAIRALQGLGYAVLSQEDLPALATTLVRLSTPEGMEPGTSLRLARETRPEAVFDYTHYYGTQITPSGITSTQEQATLPRKAGRLTIGMIDTGIVSHPYLRGVTINRRNFATGEGLGPIAHGTAVASILASEGSSRIYSANIFRGQPDRPYTSADAIVGAIEWMTANHVPVVNMSLSGPRNAVLDRLIAQAAGRGMLIVAAAGNGGPNAPPAYPAALSSVVAVTAVDAQQRVYRYANHGRYITVAALGVGQPAASVDGGISRFDGTSFATPHIAAWIARCLGNDDGPACVRSLRRHARDLGEPGHDPVYGYGLIE